MKVIAAIMVIGVLIGAIVIAINVVCHDKVNDTRASSGAIHSGSKDKRIAKKMLLHYLYYLRLSTCGYPMAKMAIGKYQIISLDGGAFGTRLEIEPVSPITIALMARSWHNEIAEIG